MIAAWHFGFNDPDPLGYLTTGGYLVGCVLCVISARTARGASQGSRSFFWFWLALAVGMLFLGINKQLDLQDEMRAIGRELASEQGWYGRRRQVQLVFASVIVAVVLGILVWLMTRGRRFVSQFPLACFGVALVVGYAVIRACAFNHTAGWVRAVSPGEKWNWVLELAGIVCVGVAALRARATFKAEAARPPRGG